MIAGKINWLHGSTKVSEHFYVYEVTQNDRRRLPRSGSQEEREILRLAKEMDRIRKLWGKPIGVTSWYRPPIVNAEVGGVSNSQHILGSAADIFPWSGDPITFENFLDRNWVYGLGYGQRAGRGFTHLDLMLPRGRFNY